MKQFLALKASAGSGKTFSLVVRYISLLFLEAKPSEILALTFTNKASNEMQQRINQVLTNLQNEPIYLEKISNECNISVAEILKKREQITNRFLKSDLSIMTIDKFLNKILRSFCWYVGVGNDFGIKGERKNLIKSTFLDSLDENDFFNLIELAYRESKSIDYFFELFEIIYEKEKEGIKYPIISQDSQIEHNIMKNAYGIKEYIINSEASATAKNAVNFSNVEELLERGKSWLIKDSLEEYRYFKKVYINSLDNYLENIKSLLPLYFEQKESNLLQNIFYFYEIYKNIKSAIKKKKNELSFNDVTNLVYTLLQERVDNEFLYFRLDTNISHILIDEFQDTSVLQYEILKPILDEIIAGDSIKKDFNKSFFYVGDPKQSIYRFRGGKRELFDYVLHIYKDFGLRVENLKTNYRTNKQIVDFVNDRFKPKIADFTPQLAHNKDDAYIKISTDEEILDSLEKNLSTMFNIGIADNQIAILTFKNDDILKIESMINEKFPYAKVVTETSSKLINQPKIKAIINYIKYIFYKEPIYKSNFLAIIGLDPFSEVYIDTKVKNHNIPKIVFNLIQKYHLFDENCLKFLELSYNYKDIYEFIHEIEFLDTSVVGKSANGIKVMTIHKSKGLEFDNVIVIDSIGKKLNRSNKLIFDYDNVKLNRIYHSFKYRENYDSEYKKAIEKEEVLDTIDTINTLYVALTRPKESLYIIQKPKDSEFDVLNLSDSEYGELRFKLTTTYKEENINPIEIDIKNYGKQEDFLKKETNLEYKPNDYEAINFGLATHFMFENLKDLDIISLDSSYKITKNRYGFLLGEKISKIREIVQNTLNNSEFLELTRGKISKEVPFVYNQKLGIIDLLVEYNDKMVIIDYKTSNKNSASLYYKQLREYKDAICEIYKKDTFAYLCFVGEEIVLKEIK
jgi:exodeoxyribonuclease V beta subunit